MIKNIFFCQAKFEFLELHNFWISKPRHMNLSLVFKGQLILTDPKKNPWNKANNLRKVSLYDVSDAILIQSIFFSLWSRHNDSIFKSHITITIVSYHCAAVAYRSAWFIMYIFIIYICLCYYLCNNLDILNSLACHTIQHNTHSFFWSQSLCIMRPLHRFW